MPNWCTNRLTVAGPADDLARFRAEIIPHIEANRGLCALFPLPAEAQKEIVWTKPDGTEQRFTAFAQPSDGDGVDGYAMALELWGTKWGDCDTEIVSEDERDITFRYQTAWGPATRLIARLSQRHPNLVFGEAFMEEGMEVLGFLVYRAGEVITEDDIAFDYPTQGPDEDDDDWYLRLNEATNDQWDEATEACDREVYRALGVEA